MTTTNNTYDWQDMSDTMRRAYDAIRRTDEALRRQWHLSDDREEMAALSAKREARYWIIREFDKYPVHQVINAAIKLARPRDWHQLLLEHPHESQGDRSKIAYTQNEAKGQKDIQTVTSVGKYLTRHFDLPDHTIRDLVSRYGSAARFQFVHTTAEMIYHLHRGPQSCMVWGDDRGVRCSDGVTRHPYEAYDPKFGWHMAVRIEGDDTMGRALCMTQPVDGKKYFVRSYLRPANATNYSQTDDGMDTWLREQGYTKENYWEDGERLAYHEAGDHFLAPYLDGGEKNVTIDAGAKALVIDSDGEYTCDQTGGCPTYDNDEDYFECDDCGDRTSNDDGYWVGRQEDVQVCDSCRDNHYQYVYGRRGAQYYVHEDDAVYVESNSEHYHSDYLGDNNIVELTNGDYEQMEEAIEINGDWYTIDDERVCMFMDTDEYGLTEDGWQCAESGNWYTDDCEEYTEYEGERYHDDYIPQRIADATADKDDAEDEPDATPQAKPLTMAMLNECSLIEERRDDGYVMFSISLLHNGRRLITRRLISQTTINQTGWDAVRTHCRKDISDDLIILSNASSPYVLEAT
jgi:hypothetical protein